MGMKTVILMALPFLVLLCVLGFSCWLGAKRKTSEKVDQWAERLGMTGSSEEQEREIGHRATQIAFNVTLVILVCVNCYEVFVMDKPLPLSNLALLTGILTQSLAMLVLRHKNAAQNEQNPPYPLWKTILLLVLIGGSTALIGMLITAVVLAW